MVQIYITIFTQNGTILDKRAVEAGFKRLLSKYFALRNTMILVLNLLPSL